jgi:hypothetical protein
VRSAKGSPILLTVIFDSHRGKHAHSVYAENASELLISLLRQCLSRPASARAGSFPSYGYDVYLPSLLRPYLASKGFPYPGGQEEELGRIMPMLYAAAWNLCRRGILRPGIREYQAQATADGASGNGYSITPFGRKWLAESDRDDFVPTESERFARLLGRYRERFGVAYQERGQEAIRCYGAHAYLACCAMCGAAAETILIATAIAKIGEPEGVLRSYNANGGRWRVENAIMGQARQELQRSFTVPMTLLKYWRDQAAHGQTSSIDDNEAFTSLALLLRLAALVNDNWVELTARDGPAS